MENKEYVLRVTPDTLLQAEREEINLRIKVVHNTKTQNLEMITSDGTRFNQGYETHAFDWELRAWNKENLIKKYEQKQLPSWFFFLVLPAEIDPETLMDINFRNAYVLTIPNALHPTIEEVTYLHPMLATYSKFMEVEMEGIGGGKFVIVYTQIDNGRIDPRDADQVSITHAKKLADRLRGMLDFLEMV